MTERRSAVCRGDPGFLPPVSELPAGRGYTQSAANDRAADLRPARARGRPTHASTWSSAAWLEFFRDRRSLGPQLPPYRPRPQPTMEQRNNCSNLAFGRDCAQRPNKLIGFTAIHSTSTSVVSFVPMRTGDSIAALGVLSVSFSGWPLGFRANEQRHVLIFVRKHCPDQPSYSPAPRIACFISRRRTKSQVDSSRDSRS